MEDDEWNYGVGDKVTLIVARCIGGISMASVICTALEAVSDWRIEGKSSSIVTRLQVILQVPLGIHALMVLLGSTMAPTGEGIWLARGNDATCTAQGFLLAFSATFGIPLDMCMSLSFLLLIQYGWSETRLRGFESYYYLTVLPFALFVSGFGLGFDLYGFSYAECFFALPETCEDDTVEGEKKIDCVPTPDSLVMIRLVAFLVNIFHMFFSFYVMFQIYRFSRKNLSHENSEEVALTRKIALKGFLYASAIAVLQIPLLCGPPWYYRGQV